MTNLLLRWLILAVSLVLAAVLTGLVMPGFSLEVKSVQDFVELFVGVALLSLLNATLGKLLKLMFFPLNCLTLGLVSLVINAVMLMIIGSLSLGFRVDGFLPALLGSILFSAANALLGVLIKDEDKKGS